MRSEMTLNDVLTDPMIALVREADGISAAEFARFLTAASQGILYPAPARRPSPDFVPAGVMPRAVEPCLFC